MELKEFLVKNRINLEDSVFSLCSEGIEIMRKSVDLNHDENHLFRIFADLNRFLQEESQIDKSKINFEVLLLSICWHDVWKSKRFPTDIISLIFDQIWDGLGSMNMFTKRASKLKLEQKLIRSVKYSIRKHARFQILPTKTIEAKILRDLDGLEEWSLIRLESLKKRYLVPGKTNPKLVKLARLAKFWFDCFMAKATDSRFYFQWSKSEFRKRKKAYRKEVDKLLLKYRHLL